MIDRPWISLLVLAILIAAGIGGVWRFASFEPVATNSERTTLLNILSSAPEPGFARADHVRPFKFPDDHGAHPAYRMEWWYVTGIVENDNGRRFGYQLTFFRNALSPRARVSTSTWATNQAYMAHFALSDIKNQDFYSDERFSRGSMELAGARALPFQVWLDNWELGRAGRDHSSWQLSARSGFGSVDLQLAPRKHAVLNGDHGLSHKSSQSDNASYYYSIPRIASIGKITIGGKSFTVRGLSWMDHEWGTSALDRNQTGWDWFGLHFRDGSDLMLYRLRNSDSDSDDPYSQGTYIDPRGRSRILTNDDFSMHVEQYWSSPKTGVRYPRRWSIYVKPLQLRFHLEPLLDKQELDLSVRYWEGAVTIEGTRNKRTELTGSGYMELTGYGVGR